MKMRRSLEWVPACAWQQAKIQGNQTKSGMYMIQKIMIGCGSMG